MAPHPPSYDGFVSYSHAVDRSVAVAVQQGLHRLAKRWYRVRALRVFRDDTSLAASPHLWQAIEEGLRRSRYFLLMASPQSATSAWVGKEIEFWQRNRDPDSFLIVVTDGEIRWDPVAGDFDWTRTTALPRQLSGWFAEEPLWVSLTGARRDTGLSLRNAMFRGAVCKLAAPMHGVAPDDLDSADIRQHRLASRVRGAAVAALSLLLVTAVVLGLVAVGQRDEARRQARIAGARALASEADSLADRDPVLAARLSLASYRLDPIASQSRQSVLRSLDRNRHAVRYLVQEPALIPAAGTAGGDVGLPGTVAVSPDGTVVAVGARWTAEVTLWEPSTGKRVGSLDAAPHTSDRFGPRMVFSADGTRLFVSTDEAVDEWDVANLRRTASDKSPSREQRQEERAGADSGLTAASEDGKIAVSGDNRGQLFLLDKQSTRTEMLVKLPDVVSDVSLSRNGEIGAAVDLHGNVVAFSPVRDRRFDLLSAAASERPTGEAPDLLPSPDGRWLLVQRPREVELWQLDDRRGHAEFPTDEPRPAIPLEPPSAAFSPDSTRFAIRSGGRVVVRELPSLREISADPAGASPVERAGVFARALGAGFLTRVEVGEDRSEVMAVDSAERKVAAASSTGLAGTPPGRALALVVVDGQERSRVTTWSLRSGELEQVGEASFDWRVGTSLAVSPNGRFVVVESEGAQRWDVVDVTTGAHTPLSGGPGPGSAGSLFAFAAGDEFVLEHVLPSRDFTGGTRLLVWDRAAGSLIGEFGDHSLVGANPFEVAEGVAGAGPASAVTVRQDGAILLWRIRPDDWATDLCGLVGDLEPDEREQYLAGFDIGRLC